MEDTEKTNFEAQRKIHVRNDRQHVPNAAVNKHDHKGHMAWVIR